MTTNSTPNQPELAIACRYCGAPADAPCMVRGGLAGEYARTHRARLIDASLRAAQQAPVDVKFYDDGEPVLDRVTPADRLTDRALWVLFMAEDRALAGYDDDPNEPDDDRHGALIAEILVRFGADATELTADYAVALHMSSDDIVRWAVDEYEHLIGIATGAIVPEWRREPDEAPAVAAQPLAADGMPLIGDPRWALAAHRGAAITIVQHLTPAEAERLVARERNRA